MKEQKMAGRKSEAVMIPSKFPVGVPKYVTSALLDRGTYEFQAGIACTPANKVWSYPFESVLLLIWRSDLRGRKDRDNIPYNVVR
jgi:hypothetical protein